MTTFNEAQHPRVNTPGFAGNGQFATKVRDEPNINLTGVAATPQVDAFTDQPGVPTGELLEALHTQARALMEEHGLHEWTLAYSSDRGKTLGVTDPARRVIVLSAANMAAINGAERRDTVLHEIAHALCRPEDGHGPNWQIKAMSLGARPDAKARSLNGDLYLSSAVIGRCPMGHEMGRGRMPAAKDKGRLYCGHKEHPRRQPASERRIEWTRNAPDPQVQQMVKRYPEPKSKAHVAVGDQVMISLKGYKYDGETGVIITVGRTNAVVKLDRRANTHVKAPFETFVVT